MPNPIAAIAISGAGSAALSVAGANKAASAQKAATKSQIGLNKYIFDQQREDQAPWREVGTEAIKAIGEGLKAGTFTMDDWQFQADPGYAFRQAEGQKAVDRMGAVSGNFLSGAQIRAATRYNQDFASEEYGRAFAREAGARADKFNFLSGAAGGGQTAVQATNADAARMAASTNAAVAARGNNLSNIYSGMYGNVAGSLNQMGENFLTYRMAGVA